MKHVLTLAIVTFLALSLLIIFQFLNISEIVWSFLYLSIGAVFGPIFGLVMTIVVLLVVLLVPAFILRRASQTLSNETCWRLLKLKKTKICAIIAISTGLCILVLLIFSCILMAQLMPIHDFSNQFIESNRNKSLVEFTGNLQEFVTNHLNNSYKRPEAAFEVDTRIYASLLDPFIMTTFGVTRSDLILYQQWGSCGQIAIVTTQLLNNAGYETRRAHFKGIDHEWAEVLDGNNWLIIDWGYIGNLIDISGLSAKSDFYQATGVEVQYLNGTVVDASLEHGY